MNEPEQAQREDLAQRETAARATARADKAEAERDAALAELAWIAVFVTARVGTHSSRRIFQDIERRRADEILAHEYDDANRTKHF